MAFSATEAAFSGIRLTLSRPLAVAGWSLAIFVAGLVSTLGGAVVAGGELAALSSQDPRAFQDVNWRALGVAYFVFLLFGLLMGAVLYTAIYRAVLRPEESRFAYLRLGGAEVRMFAVFVLVVLVFFAGVFLAFVPMWLAIFLAAAAGGGGVWSGLAAALVALVTFPLVIAVPFWLWVRLSLAGPMTLDTGRIRLGAAWRLTRGHFWPLLGAYLLSGVFLLAIWAVTTPLSMALAGMISGQGLMGIWTASSTMGSTAAEVFSPARLALLAFTSAFSGPVYAVWLAPTAHAYRQLRPETNVAETFA